MTSNYEDISVHLKRLRVAQEACWAEIARANQIILERGNRVSELIEEEENLINLALISKATEFLRGTK